MNKLPNLPIQIVGRDNVSNLYDLLGSLRWFWHCTGSSAAPSPSMSWAI